MRIEIGAPFKRLGEDLHDSGPTIDAKGVPGSEASGSVDRIDDARDTEFTGDDGAVTERSADVDYHSSGN